MQLFLPLKNDHPPHKSDFDKKGRIIMPSIPIKAGLRGNAPHGGIMPVLPAMRD